LKNKNIYCILFIRVRVGDAMSWFDKLKSNKRSLIISIVIVFLLLILTIGGTYAYFMSDFDDDSTISGDAGTAKLDLVVEKITPTSANSHLVMVPLLDAALSNALAGTGGISSCIDSVGNLSCQVYKITVTNSGTVRLNVDGTIQLVVDGSNNIFNSLKWRQLSSATSVKSGSVINGMAKSSLVNDIFMEPGDVGIYYFALWISEINSDQSNTDYGDFYGIVEFDDAISDGVTAYFGDGYTINS